MTCQPQALHNMKHIQWQWQWQYKKNKCYITKKRRTQNRYGLRTLL